jgi:hypothetical protein
LTSELVLVVEWVGGRMDEFKTWLVQSITMVNWDRLVVFEHQTISSLGTFASEFFLAQPACYFFVSLDF